MTMTEDKKFKYIICERVIDKLHDDKTLIKSVIFNISRYGRFNKKLIFYNFVTIRQAIENVEEYLSEKVTPDYYETIKDDLFYKFNDYGRDINYICSLSRGNLLTNCIYLEEIQIYRNSLSLWCNA
jgi:hypothetical protein